MENYSSGSQEIFGIEVDNSVKSDFLEMARWTKFLSILGFISLGIMMVGGFILGTQINSSSANNPFAGIGATGIIIFYVIIAAVNFYPIYALLKYSTSMKAAVQTNSKLKFNEAITYLKNFFKFCGILVVILLCLYGLIIIFAIIAAAVNK